MSSAIDTANFFPIRDVVIGMADGLTAPEKPGTALPITTALWQL
jgi:hypothetical protein